MKFQVFAVLLLLGLAVANPIPEGEYEYDEECDDIDAEFAHVGDLAGQIKMFNEEEIAPTDADCIDEEEEIEEPAFVEDENLLKAFEEIDTEPTEAADCVEEEVLATESSDYGAANVLPDLKMEVEPSDCPEEYEDIETEIAEEPALNNLDVLSNAFAHTENDAMVKLVGENQVDEVEGDCEELGDEYY